MINIVTINYHLADPKVVNTTINGAETLLDGDLIIANPEEFTIAWTDIVAKRISLQYNTGKKVRNIFNSRKNELWTLLENGKILIVFLCPFKGIKVESQYLSHPSDDYITNYDFLPLAKEYLLQNIVNGKSSNPNSISLNDSNSSFSPYFKAFKNNLEYSVYLNVDPIDKLQYFLINRSEKPVSFLLQAGKGLIVFLPPPINVDHQKLIGTLIACTKNYLTTHEVTPPPNWVLSYKLPGEDEYDSKISDVNDQIEVLTEEKRRLEDQKNEISKFKSLLFEQGPELEKVIIEAFKIFGFQAENRKVDDLEHDIVFESTEGRGIAEVEGKDNDAIHIGKLDQLNRAVDEDFELVGSYCQGILIGNHFRILKPEDRKDPFTEKVRIVAQKKSFGLLTTVEIYNAIDKILTAPDDEEYKLFCRSKILKTTGDIIKLT